ncbi:MAG: peroxidase family protein [Bdellovibrionales bacterium]
MGEDLRGFIKSRVEAANAPGLLRLAFHDAGTFCKKTNTGGVGASVMNPEELQRPVNDGLQKSVNLIQRLHSEGPEYSVADYIAMAGAVAVEITGGPVIEISLSRVDVNSPAPDGRLPDEHDDAKKLLSTFERMGLDTKDLVVLSGAHTLGDAEDKPFTDNRLEFDNSYFKNLLKADLPKHLGRFKSDEALLTVDEMKSLVEKYASDKEAFFADFTKAYVKMTELGFS